jgi:hypothetical protein
MFQEGTLWDEKRILAMSNRLKFVLAAVLVLGTAPAALAASKHVVRHTDRTVQENVVAPGSYAYPGYYAYGSSGPQAGRDAYDFYNTVPRGETYIYIQDKDFRDSNGGP